MNNGIRWMAVTGALVLAAVVGFTAWQAGVAHGIEQSGKIVAGGPYPYPYPYYWHGPFFFAPFVFLVFFLVFARAMSWRRGYWHHHHCGRERVADEAK